MLQIHWRPQHVVNAAVQIHWRPQQHGLLALGDTRKADFRQQWAHIRESMQPEEAYHEMVRNAAVQCRCLGPSTLGGIFRVSSGYLPGIFWATKKGPACGFVFMNLFKDLEQKLDEDKTYRYLSTWVLQR